MIRLTGARHALVEAFGFGWSSPASMVELGTVIQSTRRSNLDKIVDGTVLSTILKAVEQQDILIKSWLTIAYSSHDRSGVTYKIHESNISTWLQDKYWEASKPVKQHKEKKINLMMPLALRDGIYRLTTSQQKYKPSEIQLGIRADQNMIKNWHRDWKPAYDDLIALLDNLDKESLKPIAKVVHTINKKVGNDDE